MGLLLAILPAEGLSFTAQDSDVCSSCRCCVPTSSNPAPARSLPAAAKTVSLAREARFESRVVACRSSAPIEDFFVCFQSAPGRAPAVPLFQRHCALLI